MSPRHTTTIEPDWFEVNVCTYNNGHRTGALESFVLVIRMLRREGQGGAADLVAREAVARFGLDPLIEITRGELTADDWRRVLALPRGVS